MRIGAIDVMRDLIRGVGMRFEVLGSLQVRDGEQQLAIGGPQQHELLALLVANANRVVSTERLIGHLWGADPPDAARSLVQGCVAGLRRSLRVAPRRRLVTCPPGYRLEVFPGELDLDRFEDLVAAAEHARQAEPERSADLLRAALELWRGPAYDGLALDSCRLEAERLAERRLAVLEERVDADLRLGRYSALIPELQALVRDHPLRERFWGQLLRALHGANRRGDALATYRRMRGILHHESGRQLKLTARVALVWLWCTGPDLDTVAENILSCSSALPGVSLTASQVRTAVERLTQSGLVRSA